MCVYASDMTIVEGLSARVLARLILQAHVNDQRKDMVYARVLACFLRQAHVDDLRKAMPTQTNVSSPTADESGKACTTQCVVALA